MSKLEPPPRGIIRNPDGTITGWDMGFGDEHAAETTVRREPDGTITVLSIRSWPVKRSGRDRSPTPKDER